MEYRTAIVDECGSIVYWCDNCTEREIEEYLENHEEHRCICVAV